MSRQGIRLAAVAVGLGLLAAVTAYGAENHTFRAGNLVIHDYGGITPRKLPRNQPAPITGHIKASVETVDGTHPPAAQRLEIDFDRNLHVNAAGLPVCRESQLKAQSTAAAKSACRDAIVGTGSAEVEVEFPEQTPFKAKGQLIAFNGGVHGGKTVLLVHTYVNVPAPTAVVSRTTISRVSKGRYGFQSTTTIPRIAGGAGSIVAFELDIARRFNWHGHEQSYLTASCPTGHYYLVGNAHFSDGTVVHVTHALPCTPME